VTRTISALFLTLIQTSAADRFNRLAWGGVDGRPKGVIAAGLENGELALWDPAKILAGAECVSSAPSMLRLSADAIQLFQRLRIAYTKEYDTYWSRSWLRL